MNKKIWIGSLLAVLMLVSISFVSSAEVSANVEKKESPLYKVRSRRAVGEKIGAILDNIKTKFLAGRMLFLPFQGFRNIDDLSLRERFAIKTVDPPVCTVFWGDC